MATLKMKQLFLILLAKSVAGQVMEDYYRSLQTAAFTNKLYQYFVEDSPSRNIIASPISVEVILSMIYLGAKGRTADELEKTLILPRDKREVASIYKRLLAIIEGYRVAVTLDLANRVYVSNLYTINAAYNNLVKDSFKAKAVTISFNNRTKAAAQINRFVMDQTHGKDKNCVAPSDIKTDDKVILVNAIYFKGQWETGFDPKNTQKQVFYLAGGGKSYVQMMDNTGLYRMKTFRFGQVLELPFANSSDLIMVIYKPWEHSGLAALEKQMPYWSWDLPKHLVRVQLPKFKIDFREPLSDPLKSLGIRDLFTDEADLSDLLSQNRARVSKVFHHAVLEIDENGAEASTSRTSDDGPVECFIGNTPFGFVIRDDTTIYLQGQFVDPEMQG